MSDQNIAAAVAAAVAEVGPQPGPLLEVLHVVQRHLGCVPEAAVPLIAEALNLSRAEVHGTITFYHFFRRTPAGRWVVQVCRAESCLSMGGDAVAAHAEKYLGVSMDHGAVTTPCGRITLEPVYCLGLCSQSPAALVGDDPHVHLTPDSVETLLAGLLAEAPADTAKAATTGGAA